MWLFQTIFDFLLFVLLDLIGYSVARLVLPLVSFGRISVAPYGSDHRWFGKRDGLGRMEVGATPASCIGLVVLVVFLMAFAFLMR